MKLSIITINRNNAAGLEKTIRSVAAQTYQDFEYIVIDGASSDSSVDVVKKYADKVTYWLSEPDTGIYNAMNKGIRQAKGDYCLFLNSGDWLVENETLENVFIEVEKVDKAGIYYSDVIYSNNATTKFKVNLDVNHLIYSTINHQNSIINTSLFRNHHYYNEKLRISSDWEFFLEEMWLYKTKFVHITTKIAVFDTNGISYNASNLSAMNMERKQVLNNVFGDLSKTLLELDYFRHSIFWVISRNQGYNKMLKFLLRIYLFLFRCFTGKKESDIFNNDLISTAD